MAATFDAPPMDLMMLVAGSMPPKVAICATYGKKNSSEYGDRRLKRYSLQKGMARKRTYKSEPRHATNQWFREALAYRDDAEGYLTYDDVAAYLNKSGLKQVYDKTIVQKMTTIRQISLDEAKCISALTGFPMTERQQEEDAIDSRFSRLSKSRQSLLLGLLDDLEAAEAADQAKRS